jgi:uncharacterized protein (AIM24 family)
MEKEVVMSVPKALQEVLTETAQKAGKEKFQLESSRMLEVNLTGDHIWTKLGTMVAYRGGLKFERERAFERGLGMALKRFFTGEASPLMKVTGRGALYIADSGKHITLLKLQNESLFVNGNDLLAFEPKLQWDIRMIRRIAGMLAGGLFCVQLSGSGVVAICSHGDPMTLHTSSGAPVSTDPNATIAWSGNMFPDLKTDVSLRTFLGRGSGESLQMHFNGDGFVIVQPYEEKVSKGKSAG